VQLEKVVLISPYNIDGTFATLKVRHVDAVLAVGDPIVYRERVRIAELALGPQVHDARVAALCRLHGVSELWTADRDFSRFHGLTFRNPLIG